MSLLQATHVSLKRDQHYLLKDIQLELNAGELVGLIGPNGAGKSTLLKILAGITSRYTGEVQLQGRTLKSLKAQERSQKLAWLEQNGSIHWPLTVERLVALGRTPHLTTWQTLSATDQMAIEAALQQTGIEHLKARDATSLSGGEKTRVLLARAIASQPLVLLADEPIAALDLGYQLQTLELLRSFAQENRACMVVLHDLALAARYCNRLYLLQSGCIVDSGTVSKVLNTDNLKKVYQVDCEINFAEIPWIIPKRFINNKK